MTSKRLWYFVIILIIVGTITSGVIYLLPTGNKQIAKSVPPQINIGWQTAWSQQGQVIQAMDRTNIRNLLGVNLHFIGFLFGPDLNEAANAGSLTITNAGIVPIINLFAANPNWIIIARQVDFDVCIVAGHTTNIRTVSGLAGHRFAVPIGGGSHPFAIESLREAGLEEGTGPNQVEVINVKPSEMPLALKGGQVDAIASWDPTTTLAIDTGGKIVKCARYVGFVAANKRFAEANREQIIRLLEAYELAYFYAAQHKGTVDQLFSDASKISLALVTRLPTPEANLHAKSPDDVLIVPTPSALALTQKVADIMLSLNLIGSPVKISSRIDLSYAREADLRLKAQKELFNKVSITTGY